MIAIKAFIFDLDGVLVDTAEYHYLAWQRLANEEGLPFDRNANEALRGISRRESLMLILKKRIVSEQKIQEMMERKNLYYLEFIHEITHTDLLPGAHEFLLELHAAGLKSVVGSASKNAREVLERLGISPLLDGISDGFSVDRPKPAPDLFLHAARQLNLLPAQCVVVEDAAAGIAAAMDGGFHSLGIGPRQRVGAAEIVIIGLYEAHLPALLEQFEEREQ
jgi:beta-phosphoglucomutase